MSDDQGKKSDRESIEQRRKAFLRHIELDAMSRAHAQIARSGVCLSMIMRSGEEILQRGDWAPSTQSRALATDPEAPASLLLHLSRYLAEEVLANPALPLGLLENPALLQQVAPETLLALARHPRAPAALLTAILRTSGDQRELRLAIAAHPTAPEDLLRELSSDPDEDVRTVARLRIT